MKVHHGVVEFSVKLVVIVAHALSMAAALGGCADHVPPEKPENDFSTTVVPADPVAGFNFPYVLRVPVPVVPRVARYLLVEPNNSGHPTETAERDLADAVELSQRGLGSAISRALRLPLLMPVFPRFPDQYTAGLDRRSLSRTDPVRGRIDRQLIAMIADARHRLGELDLPTHDKVIMTGFSASAHFANRFTALYPARVRAVVAGALSGVVILPYGQLDGAQLPYPLGVQDIQRFTGSPFQADAWRHVPEFLFMGANDSNDWAQGSDVYSDAERRVVFDHLGARMLPDRWERCEALYRRAGVSAVFKTYPNVGHWTNGAIHSDAANFLTGIMRNDREAGKPP
jgi:hypothetical protein